MRLVLAALREGVSPTLGLMLMHPYYAGMSELPYATVLNFNQRYWPVCI